MKILYDNQALFNNNKFGIKNYFTNLISANDNRSVQTIIIPSISLPRNKISFLINTIISIIYIKKGEYDLLHPTYYHNYFLKYLKKDFVLTIYDMIPELVGGSVYTKTIENKKSLIENAKHVFTISQQTREDLLKYYPFLSREKITVIYPSSSIEDVCEEKEISELAGISFITYVGNRKLKYKNFCPFLVSVSKLLKEKKLTLLCVGGGRLNRGELEIIKKSNIEKYIIQKKLNKKELKWVYQNSIIFICPSSYEGFGLPIIEAQANNCPVLCSDTPVFKEIARNTAFYFKNNNFKNLADELTNFLKLSPNKINELLAKALINSKKYSWKKSAKILNDTYQKIISS